MGLISMGLLKIVVLLVIVQVISCQNYEELARDDCFKKVYLCGDYRASVTGPSGRLATEPHRFSEICRKNKEFIACVEQAADFCSDKLRNISRMVLDNRRNMKLFCTDLEWKRNYFSSAQCINENEKSIMDECLKEEEEGEDDRPYWCLIPEPCDALERVFLCTVRKMKKYCGSVAAEVHRRMHILKMENRDVVCKIRQLNPMYCRYKRQKPSQTEFGKRIGSLSDALSEAINKIFEATLVDTMDNFALLLNEENISNLLDSEEYKLRKSLFKAEVEEKFSPFFKKCKLPGGELSQQLDLTVESYSLLVRNIQRILSEASSQSSKFGSTFYENILKSCGTESVVLASCLGKLKELEVLKSLNPVAGVSKELNAELKALKDYILGLFELLSCNEDFLVNNINEDAALITWDNMSSFPLQSLSCEWKYETNKEVFQCSIKLKLSDPKTMQTDIDSTTTESAINADNVNEFIKPFILESSLFTDLGSGDFVTATDARVIELDSSETDMLDYEVHDIHRMGQQIVLPEEIDSEEISNRKSSRGSKELHGERNNEDSREETAYILVDPPYSPTDSVSYFVVDSTSNPVQSYLDSLEKSSSVNPESEFDTEKTDLEKENLKLQLRKIVSALNERFANVEVKDFESKRDSIADPVKKQKFQNLNFQIYYPPTVHINKSFQTELQDFLKAKLNEYTEIYSMSSRFPNIKMRGARHKRAMNERQNSKMDKSFSGRTSNESVRTNSKFTNFKAEL